MAVKVSAYNLIGVAYTSASDYVTSATSSPVNVSTYNWFGFAYTSGVSEIPTSAIPSDYFTSGAVSGVSTDQTHVGFLNGNSYQDSISLIASFNYFISDYKTVQFLDNSSGFITSWLWDFGDGTSATDKNPIHIYSDYNTSYDVVLTVNDLLSTSATIITGSIPVSNMYFAESSGFIFRSTQPEVQWELTTFDKTNRTFYSLTTGNGLVAVLCRNLITLKSEIAISSDFGDTWNYYLYDDYRYQYKLRFANGFFVCSPEGTSTRQMLRSVDGVNWTIGDNEYAYGFIEAHYVANMYCLVMGDSYGYRSVKYSNSLNTLDSPVLDPYKLPIGPIQILNGNIFTLATYAGPGVYTSTDGINYTLVKLFTGYPLWLFLSTVGASANNRSSIIVFLSYSSTFTFEIIKSTDGGISFSDPIDLKTLIGETGSFTSPYIFYDDTNFVVCYNNGNWVWCRSVDLVTWEIFTPNKPISMNIPNEFIKLEV
jgi:PKD repeat protein